MLEIIGWVSVLALFAVYTLAAIVGVAILIFKERD